MKRRILIVDDDRFLLESIHRLLTANDFEVVSATDGDQALAALEKRAFDLMVLDVGLPNADGLTVCRRVRTRWNLPVIMLTARSDAMDKILGLEVGADDYITKPFEPAELIARIRAQLRRSTEYQKESGKGVLTFGELCVDEEQRDAIVAGKACGLTSREFELLAELARNAGKVVTREHLFQKVWGYAMDFNSNSLDVYMYRVRKKLEAHEGSRQCLQTMKGYGYKLEK